MVTQALLAAPRTAALLGIYCCLVIPFSILLLTLSATQHSKCPSVANWSIAYGIFSLLAPLLLLPPMLFLGFRTKLYTSAVAFLGTLAYLSFFISGLVILIRSVKNYDCMHGSGMFLWVIGILSIMTGICSVCVNVESMYKVWKFQDDQETLRKAAEGFERE